MSRLLAVLALAVPLGLVSAAAGASERPTRLTLCHEDQNSYPWVLRDRPGLNILLLRLVERDAQVRFDFVSMPWKRCLVELAAGRVDGAFAASFRSERLEMGVYPGAEPGKPDPARRLHVSSYSLYRLRGDNIDWDGRQFSNLRGAVGILSGFSIGDFLKDKGVTIDEGSKSPEDTLRKLIAGRLQGAALQTPRAEHVLQSQPELARRIERVTTPLEERPYYLMLSHQLVKRHPAFAGEIWNAVMQARESPEFRRIEAEFYAQP